jgi:hypothetical protein
MMRCARSMGQTPPDGTGEARPATDAGYPVPLRDPLEMRQSDSLGAVLNRQRCGAIEQARDLAREAGACGQHELHDGALGQT